MRFKARAPQPRGLWLAGVLLLAVATLVAMPGVGVPEDAPEPGLEVAPSQEDRVDTAVHSFDWPWGDVPVAYGYEVPVHVVRGMLALCECPQIPDAGPASPQHVSKAWTNGVGTAVVEYDDGISLGIDDAFGETPEQYEAVVIDHVQELGWGSLTPVRGAGGLGVEYGEGLAGRSAHIVWVEGGFMFQVWGNGGQTLEEVIGFAESLPYCPGCQT